MRIRFIFAVVLGFVSLNSHGQEKKPMCGNVIKNLAGTYRICFSEPQPPNSGQLKQVMSMADFISLPQAAEMQTTPVTVDQWCAVMANVEKAQYLENTENGQHLTLLGWGAPVHCGTDTQAESIGPKEVTGGYITMDSYPWDPLTTEGYFSIPQGEKQKYIYVKGFLDYLNRSNTGYIYRLPTEAELKYIISHGILFGEPGLRLVRVRGQDT